MADYYFAASSKEALDKFKAGFVNTIGVTQGRAAVSAHTEKESGLDVPAQEAVGDPQKFYCCIRSDKAIIPPKGIEEVKPDVGSQICAGWL